MSFTSENLAGRPDLIRSVYELGGIVFNGQHRGSEYQVLCPFHDDHHPSLSVNVETALYICRACNASGDAVSFLAQIETMSTDDSIAEIRKRLDIPNGHPVAAPPAAPTSRPTVDAAAFWESLAAEDAEGIAYLEARRLWPVAGVRFVPGEFHRIAVPLYNAAGELVNVQRRPAVAREKIPEGQDFRLMAGAPVKGTSFGRLEAPGAVWIVEGLTDFLAASLLAPLLAVVPLGVPGVSNAAALVQARAAQLAGRIVRVSFDEDEPGRSAAAETTKALEAGGARPVLTPYPAGFKDLAEIVEKLGCEAAAGVVREMFAAAPIPGSWESLPTLVEVLGSMPPPGERFSTGIPPLDRCSRGGFAPGRVYTFVGPPSRGKTALVAQLALRWARERGAIVIGYFCDEGSWQAALMMAEGIGFERDDVEDRFAERRAEIDGATRDLALRFPSPDAPETLLDAVEDWSREAAGRQLVVVADSIQKVRCRKGLEAKTPKERADAFMETARLVSHRTNGIFLLTAKANCGSWASKNPLDNVDPLAAGLDSSAIEYDSDALFFLEGDTDRTVNLIVAKNRPGDGTKPRIPLRFDRARARFEDVDPAVAEEQAEAAVQAKRMRDAEKVGGEIIAVLKRHPGLSGDAIWKEVGGRKETCADARRGLDSQGLIVGVPGRRGSVLWSLKS